MNILVVDATFLGRAPNREKTLAHIKYWRKEHDARIFVYTTGYGREFYGSNLEPAPEFIRIPLSKDYEQIDLLWVPIEYLKRIFGSLFVRIPADVDVSYSISSIIVDVLCALVLKARHGKLRCFCVFDNFVPPPRERPGSFVLTFIPYAAFIITRRFLSRMDGIFSALTDSNHARFLKNFRGKALVVQTPNGLDLEQIERAAAPAEKEWDFAYMGRMHPAKGVFDVLSLVASIKNDKKDVRVVMIGPEDPAMKPRIQRFIEDNSLQQNVVFSGFVSRDEKYRLLKSSKIFAFLSYDESFPVSFMEAIACKLAVIAYDLPVYKDPPYRDAHVRVF